MSAASAARRERIALSVARFAALAALLGAFASPPLTNVASVVLLVAFLALPSAAQRFGSALGSPLGRAAALLLAVLALAMLWSDAAWAARWHAWWNWRSLLLLLLCLAVFDDAVARIRFLVGFVALAGVGMLASYAAYARGVSWALDHGLPGIVLRNSATQGMTFALAALCAMALAVYYRAWPVWMRLTLAMAALLLLVNVFFVTSSRSGHIVAVLFVALIALQALHGWRRILALASVPLVTGLVYAASPVMQNRFDLAIEELHGHSTPGQLTPPSMGIRTVMWQTSWEMVRERPLAGYGMGGYVAVYAHRVRDEQSGWRATPTTDPHNQYLSVQLQAGVLGSIAFLWLLLSAARMRSMPPFRAIGIAALAGWCASSLMNSHFETFNEGHMIALLLGVMLGAAGSASSAEKTADSTAS